MTRYTTLIRILPGLAVAALATASLMPHRAQAQSALPVPTGMGPVVQGNPNLVKPAPSQPGLPGASRQIGGVTRGAISGDMMSPNTALFDAIDRGDFAAAQDAVGRGADLRATNAVGQTPIDESVNLGRNNITFLLVTLLHADGDITDAQGPMNMPPASALGLSTHDEHAASQPVAFFGGTGTTIKAGKPRRYQPAAVKQTTPARPSGPTAYGDSSGAPVPAAGFLGFGNGTSQP